MAQHRRPLALSAANRRIAIAVGAILGAAALLYFGAILAVGDGVRAGTTVAGVAIGGMTQAEATSTLESTLGKTSTKQLRVLAAGNEFVIKPMNAGLSFDAAATVATVAGRTLNPFTLVADLMNERAVDPVVMVDEQALTSQVEGMAVAIDRPAEEPALTMKGRTPKLKDGKNGRALDQEATRAALVKAFLLPRKPVTATVNKVEPLASAEAAQQGLKLAETAVENPVIVAASDITATLRPDAIASALSFTAVDGALVPVLDGAVLHASIADQLIGAETPGRDATFKIKAGKPVVVPSVVGQGIADDELASQVVTVLGNNPPDRAVSVSMGVRDPKLTTEQAMALGVTEKLSTFRQDFPYAAYRVQNIGQGAEYVNGTLLLPGETFSMNDTMKERTEKNGYTVGFIIGNGGVFAEDLGGGVSAATTTVWTGAFFAGMERVFTQAHSIYISRYQPGLEATVAWGYFDMKFKNNTPNGVFITTKMTNTSMTVNFWGTRIYDDIQAEFGPRTNVKPASTVYDKSSTCLGQGGMDGFSINVDRVFYQGGKEVKRETITTNYRPSPKVICGKKPKPAADKNPKPSASATASASAAPSDAAPSDAAPTPATSVEPSVSESKAPSKKPSAQASSEPSASASKKPPKS